MTEETAHIHSAPRLNRLFVQDRLESHVVEMENWLHGRLSWTNLGFNEPYTPDVIATMDAMEVAKHSYAIQAYATLLKTMSPS